MFSFLKKFTPNVARKSEVGPPTIDNLPVRQAGRQSTILSLKGLHCSSCALNIDLALEDLPSVESKTNYAKSECKVTYDPQQTSLEKIKSTIIDLGYQVIQ